MHTEIEANRFVINSSYSAKSINENREGEEEVVAEEAGENLVLK